MNRNARVLAFTGAAIILATLSIVAWTTDFFVLKTGTKLPSPDEIARALREQSVVKSEKSSGADGFETEAAERFIDNGAVSDGQLSPKVRVVRDGDPVKGVRLDATGIHDSSLRDARVSGKDGFCVFRMLSYGPYVLTSDRGHSWPYMFSKRDSVATLDLGGGVDISGKVLEPNRQRLCGDARVYIAPVGQLGLARLVEDACIAGSFSVLGVDRGAQVFARAPSFTDSPVVRLAAVDDLSGLELVLGGAARRLSVEVRDSNAQPVPSASISVANLDSGVVGAAPLISGRTGEGGTWSTSSASRVAGLSVRVDKEGFAPVIRKVPVGATDIAVLITLVRGARIFGKIVDADGRAVSSAKVHFRGDIAGYEATVRSAPDGSYALECVPPCRLNLVFDGGGLIVERGVTAVDGGSHEVNVVFQQGVTLSGALVDAEKQSALVGWTVEILALGPRGFKRRRQQTGRDGGFRFERCSSVDHTLVVRSPLSGAELFRKVVSPKMSPVRVGVSADMRATCRVKGKLVDANGRPVVGEVLLYLDGVASRRKVVTANADGVFVSRLLPPGSYRALAQSGRYSERPIGRRRLASAETWDLGEVRLDKDLQVSVKVDGSGVSNAEHMIGELRSAVNGDVVRPLTRAGGGVWKSPPIAPGGYDIGFRGRNFALVAHRINVTQGGPRQFDIKLNKGVPCKVDFEAGIGTRKRLVDISVRFVDASRGIAMPKLVWTTREDRPRPLKVNLAPGDYIVEAWTQSPAKCARKSFSVGQQGAAVSLSVR